MKLLVRFANLKVTKIIDNVYTDKLRDHIPPMSPYVLQERSILLLQSHYIHLVIKVTTFVMTFSITCYLELQNAIHIDCKFHNLSKKFKMIVYTL